MDAPDPQTVRPESEDLEKADVRERFPCFAATEKHRKDAEL